VLGSESACAAGFFANRGGGGVVPAAVVARSPV
jgi:hypothetical protein